MSFSEISAKVYEHGLHNSGNLYGSQVFVSATFKTLSVEGKSVADMEVLTDAFSEWSELTEDEGEALMAAIEDTVSEV